MIIYRLLLSQLIFAIQISHIYLYIYIKLLRLLFHSEHGIIYVIIRSLFFEI
jgi:hypothetical protein